MKCGLQIPFGHPTTRAVLRAKTKETYCRNVFMKITSVAEPQRFSYNDYLDVKLKDYDLELASRYEVSNTTFV